MDRQVYFFNFKSKFFKIVDRVLEFFFFNIKIIVYFILFLFYRFIVI